MEFVDLHAQYERYRGDIDARIGAVLRHARFIMGPEIDELEAALAALVGVRHAITVASGTVSLEIALRALDIGAGDEVITVPFTWISSAEVISLVGATPVFVDVRPDTFTIDVEAAERAVTPRTRAIIAVDLFGQMADYRALTALTARTGVPVIEDAAQSLGARQEDTQSGAAARVGSTSFFPAKPLGCFGDGGAIFSDDDQLADRMRAIRTHGGLRRHDHRYVGMNARFDTLQAAVLLAKLPHFPCEIEQRQAVATRYDQGLGDLVTVPTVGPGNTHVYAQYTVRTAHRDHLAAYLKAAGIPSAVYYPKCLHFEPVFAPLGHVAGDFPVAEAASREVISLPMHPFLSEQEQEDVIQTVRRFFSAGTPTQ